MSATRIDLRSDTVTRPSPAMREAIARAGVGDDVYGEDPSVNELEAMTADIVGMEAALFVPSGTMANQIAIKIHTQPGDEVLVGQKAHNWLFESGGAGAISGVQVTLLPGDGRFSGEDVRAARKADDHHVAPTRLVSVENTHNMAGGVCWDADDVRGVQEAAREFGLALHLDGARVWNAAVHAGRPERDLCAGFDTVSVCLSKGLGAPVGSLLCGSRALMHKAHRIRKMLGGGMRQAGILAAAGSYALREHRARLADDHANAAALARTLAAESWTSIDVARVHTNIVMIDIAESVRARLSAQALCRRAAEQGVLASALSNTRVRLVTHLDVDAAACERAAQVLIESARALLDG
jgi:threonine aldolase